MSNNSVLAQPAAFIEEALHTYRASSSGWEKANGYFYPTSSNRTAIINPVVDPGVKLHSIQPLPPTFTSQYGNVRYQSFMGLFPEINRAWLTVDNKLFLWAYTSPQATATGPHPSAGTDLYVYEGITQIIVSVAIVRPRPGVFVESVKFLLAIATAFDVTLVGVSFAPSGEISLLPTEISVATDTILMLKLTSTLDGRIFMAGADGSLHELTYESNPRGGILDLLTGRPAKRMRKVVHTPSPLSSYLPAALRTIFAKSDELVDLAIDTSRSALYTLSQGGTLAVYDISHPRKTKTVSSVNVAHESRNLVSFGVPPGEREFVSIHAIHSQASIAVHLIVVTSYGERIYFSTMSGSMPSGGMSRDLSRSVQPGENKTVPKGLTCVGYRPSPDRQISRSSHPCVHVAICERGAAVFADLKDTESDRLIYIYPDIALHTPSTPQEARNNISKVTEVVFENFLGQDGGGPSEERRNHGTPFTPTAPSTPRFNFDSQANLQMGPKRTFAIAEERGDGSPLSNSGERTPSQPPRFFWVLTSSAMHLYERVQPVDRLKEILQSGDAGGLEMESFFKRYGAAEACAMCLEVAISNAPLLTAASYAFHKYGNDPQFDRRQSSTVNEGTPWNRPERENLRGPVLQSLSGLGGGPRNGSTWSAFDVGRPSLQSIPLSQLSGAHDGAILFLAKTLHPLWNQFLSSSRDPDGFQNLTVSKEIISDIREQVMAIVSFLSNYTPDNARTGNMAESLDPRNREVENDFSNRGHESLKSADAYRRECNSLNALKELGEKVVEGLALLLILADHQLHRIWMSMPREKREMVSKIRFHELVVSEEGIIVAASLIEAIFNSYTDGQGAVDRVGLIMRDRCGSFFGDSDVQLHRGLAKLRDAVASIAGIETDENGNALPPDPSNHYYQRWLETDPGATNALDTAQAMAEEAARILKVVPDRIFDIDSVCHNLKTTRALPSLVHVALSIGKAAEGKGDENRASTAYRNILEALGPLVHGDGMGTDQMEPAVADHRLRDSALRLALNADSQIFLRKLYEFLLSSKSGEMILLEHKSPNFEGYLEEKKKLSLLWRYSANHGRYIDAAGVLLSLGESAGEMQLVERVNYLSCALHNAKIASSNGDARAVSLLREITAYLDVAKVQMRVREELQSRHDRSPEVEKALGELDSDIWGLSELFNKYARPFGLYEACLAAFRCGGYRDDAYVQGLWRDIVERESESVTTPSLLSQKIVALGREFYPNDIAFPMAYIIDLLERIAYKNASVPSWTNSGDWVVYTMRGIGIPLSDLVDGYRNMVDNPHQSMNHSDQWSWTDESAQLHVLQAIERVINIWVSQNTGNESFKSAGADRERRSMISEGDRVLRTITLCKSRLRGMSAIPKTVLVQKFDALENKITPLVQ